MSWGGISSKGNGRKGVEAFKCVASYRERKPLLLVINGPSKEGRP